ncbi:MAG: acyl-CoA dehydratase activase-related protein [Acutalibacteraceae bacterium]
MKIGIIKGLYYYEYGDLWLQFLQKLGHECVTAEIHDSSCFLCTDEACLPVKIYHKNAMELLDMGIDCLFSPKIIKCAKDSFTCPKVIGINEMLAASLKPSIRMISPEFSGEFKTFYARTGLALGNDTREIKKAIEEMLVLGSARVAFMSLPKTKKGSRDDFFLVCLLGHKYIVEDSFINMDIKKRLKKLNIRVVTSDLFDNDFLSSSAENSFSHAPFWITGRQAAGLAAVSEAAASQIDGYIYLTAFGCGPDSFIVPLTKKYIRDMSAKPFMEISLDEHTSAAGLDTRLEAFADMLGDRVRV